MNAGNSPFFVLPEPSDAVEILISSVLRSAGYLVVKSFDLHTAIQNHEGCECRSDSCDCQIIVLLIYAPQGAPITLMLDGNKNETSVYLVNDSNHPAHSILVQKFAQRLPDTLLAINPLDSFR